VLDRDIVAMED